MGWVYDSIVFVEQQLEHEITGLLSIVDVQIGPLKMQSGPHAVHVLESTFMKERSIAYSTPK